MDLCRKLKYNRAEKAVSKVPMSKYKTILRGSGELSFHKMFHCVAQIGKGGMQKH